MRLFWRYHGQGVVALFITLFSLAVLSILVVGVGWRVWGEAGMVFAAGLLPGITVLAFVVIGRRYHA